MSPSSSVPGLLADLRRAASPGGRRALGCCLLEGTRIHERALRAGVTVERCLVSRSYLDSGTPRAQALLDALRAAGCEPVVADDAIVAAETGGRDLGGILGLARIPEPEAWRPRDATRRELMLVAVDVEDPGNVGALVRTALAAGASGFAAVGISDPYHPRAIRTSMGSLFRIPVHRYAAYDDLDADLARAGASAVAAVSRGGTPLPAFDAGPGPIAVLVGREAFGLPGAIVDRVPRRVSIPMASEVDSYSVHAAAAIVLYALTTAGNT